MHGLSTKKKFKQKFQTDFTKQDIQKKNIGTWQIEIDIH